jgi:hypothetical protein
MFQSDYWKHNEVYNWNKSNKVHQGTANDFHQDNSVVNRISQRFLPAASYNFQVPKSVLFVQIGKTQTIDK